MNYIEDISIKGESYKISKIIFVLYHSKLSSNSVAITILINEYLQNFDVIISKYVIYWQIFNTIQDFISKQQIILEVVIEKELASKMMEKKMKVLEY